MVVSELTRKEKERAMEGLMFVCQKRSGEYKGRLAYKGKPAREWITHEDKSSPTAYTESIMLTCAIDAMEQRDMMTVDVPNTFIQTDMPTNPEGERVVMKVRGRLVNWLVQMEPCTYEKKVVYKKGQRILYLEVKKAIYGMLVSSLLWYRKIKKDLEGIGFEFNPYDSCVANRVIGTHQQTLRLHVDDMLVSCKDEKVNTGFHEWCQRKYSDLKPVKCTRGEVHSFLGMVLDFGKAKGTCHVTQDDHVSDLIESFPEKLRGNSPSLAGSNLFRRGSGGLLCSNQKETFHTCVTKALFIAKHSRPDVALAVSVLSSCVREPTKDDWRKLRRLVDYMQATQALHLVLKVDEGIPVVKWFVDASFVVHDNFRSHTGRFLTLSNGGGAPISASLKQKLNTRSSKQNWWAVMILLVKSFGLAIS